MPDDAVKKRRRGRPAAGDPATAFGRSLRSHLQATGKTATELSGEIGVSVPYISALSSGAKVAGPPVAAKIADALGLQGMHRAELYVSAAIDAGFELNFVRDALDKAKTEGGPPVLDLELPDDF